MEYKNVAEVIHHHDTIVKTLDEAYSFKWYQFLKKWRARKQASALRLQLLGLKAFLSYYPERVIERARQQYLVEQTKKETV